MKPIKAKLEAEREAHAATKKELEKLRDVLGVIEEQVERFQANPDKTEEFVIIMRDLLAFGELTPSIMDNKTIKTVVEDHNEG